MSGSKLPVGGHSPAVWLWSFAFLLPGALAAIAASTPSAPSAGGAGSAETRLAASPLPILEAAPSAALQARRILIDRPGQEPTTSWLTDVLLFDPQAGGAHRGGSTPAERSDPESETAEAPQSAEPSAADLSPELLALREKVERALTTYYPRHQTAVRNNPWEVMHAIIAYGVHTKIFKDQPGGETVNAVGWMCYNYPCAGQRMLFLNGGAVDAGRGVGLQGHGGQFLAILAQSHVMADYPLRVEGKDFTLKDLIEREKSTCQSGTELTFKLISLAHYLDSDETWKTPDGQEWSIPRLIREELAAPIRGAACGGTHRLMGYSYALRKRVQRSKPVDGEFRRAQVYTQDYHRYTFSLQNPDGSFSTAWFERKGNDPSVDRRLKTTGHILEWIAFSLSDDELRDPRMVKAVDYLATLLLSDTRRTWEIGPLGHGLHALAIYHDRVFESTLPLETPPLATGNQGAAWEARRTAEVDN